MQRPNTTIDDVCAAIGFTATVTLIRWSGGTHIYIPGTASDDHVLARLIGLPAMRALVREFGNETLWVPDSPGGQHQAADALKKRVRGLVLEGKGTAATATELAISHRHVQRIRRELEAAGLLPEALPKNAPEKVA